ncbi:MULTISPECIES: hypothetical protein [unclassified Streptomyces]|uniref:hypothetical protein n=1 Tax=unclassified Streptomyces TaxID=2593676 RepID=UPI00341FF06C|nr:hypothetical protein OG348_16295 [Streptomyces sp. NBC_01243]WSX03280.1 hypothetical protein OG355_24305 [Streptomyces sp. NBC_00987]
MRILGAAVLAAGVLLLTGCGKSGDSTGREMKMNMQEAAMRADEILDGTFAAIKPSVHWTHDESIEGVCDVQRSRAVMTIVSEERRGSFLGVIERYWKSQGYEQLAVNKSKSPAMYYRTPDGFNVRVLIGSNGQAFFEVATPCVNTSKVSPPKAETVGPNYAGRDIPFPDVKSDFWSAKSAPSSRT